ncbi:hypothetical protein [Scytonema sp. UIC 10036]|nr:hypothetical protein [Scytonema sp. UIC 10036]
MCVRRDEDKGDKGDKGEELTTCAQFPIPNARLYALLMQDST